MKKLVVLVVLGLFASMAVFAAETASSTVTASVATFLAITSPPAVALGSLDPLTATASVAETVNARSNLRSWVIKAYALKGKLTEYASEAYTDTEQIPYTLSINGGTAAAPGIVAESAAIFASFTAKTTGGTAGQTIPFVITAGTEGGVTWQAANYQDVITFVISVN